MRVNEESTSTAYILGQIFAVLEAAMRKGRIQTLMLQSGIADFNSACTTPSTVFPIIMRLKNSHIRKIDNAGMRFIMKRC